jgi:hypothetical protein
MREAQKLDPLQGKKKRTAPGGAWLRGLTRFDTAASQGEAALGPWRHVGVANYRSGPLMDDSPGAWG